MSVKMSTYFRTQCSRGLGRGPVAAHLLELLLPIPLGVWMFFCCECCVLSGRGLCVGWSLIQRTPTESSVSTECDRKSP